MNTIWKSLGLLTAFLGAATTLTAQPLITFDDRPAGTNDSIDIPNGYGGLNWDNFSTYDDLSASHSAPNGYLAGMISPHNVALNTFGTPASISSATGFDLGSGYFTAAWFDDLHLQIQGYQGAVLAYDHTYILSAVSPSLIILNYADVTSVTFNSFGGTLHPGYDHGMGTQFALDDLQIGLVPEPAAGALGALGLILSFFRRLTPRETKSAR